MQFVAKKIGFQNFIAIGPKGRAGGICLFWENDLEVDILEYNSNMIAIRIKECNVWWSLVGFYGPPYMAKRLKAWINLRALLETIQGPWLCCGDFNVMMDDFEKEGGVCGSSSIPSYLKDIMFDLGAVDLGFAGNKFTWSNRRWGRNSIRERLDRGIANIEWRLAFPKANVIHLSAVNSDHCPLLIDTNPQDSFSPRPFRFEAVWAKDPRCYEVINQAWKKQFVGSVGFRLFQKQRVTAEALKHWNKTIFGYCQTRISELTTTIEEVQANPPIEANLRLEAKLQCDLNGWLAKLEIVWKQKSRELWLKEGDRNSKFFHLSTIICRRRNAIDVIKGDNGVWIVNRKEIKDFVVDKFQDLFTEDQVMFPAGLEQLISPSITDVDNNKLCSIPTPLEIKEVVFGMYSDKAPGPDGLPALFYKRYWPIVGKSVCDAALNFFKSRNLLTEVNNTFIVLIPKTQSPSFVNHYRPISLCNTVYKIIAKILVSRIRPVLDSLISPCQSAFILDRWIVENQLIVQEILHSFKKRKVKGGFVALKVDLQKAYDRVNWSFLKEVLYRFGFHEKFIMWIMQCVTKVSFSILINGGKTKSFIPSRGLRQGDPLSPYLFILSQEVLSRLIERSFASGAIHGVKMNTNGPAFTHVMYADDLMLFAKATTREVQVLDECLEKYCEWFVQLINREKSSLIFSKLVVRERKRAIKLELNMKAISSAATYLSAPLFTSRSRTKDFKFLQDRLESKLKGWRCKSLSWVGRSTLIKSVAQALPTYTFASSDVPIAVCDKLDAATRRFWWKPNRESGSYLAWKAWDHLCSPKGQGGLGFHKAKRFNDALLAKLTWMVVSDRNSLCIRAFRNKDKVDREWMHREDPKNASPT